MYEPHYRYGLIAFFPKIKKITMEIQNQLGLTKAE